MADAMREQLPALHDMFVSLGAIESVAFLENDAILGNIYGMKLTNGAVRWAVALDPAGKVVMWLVLPGPGTAQKKPR
jgi:hypothetical protein